MLQKIIIIRIIALLLLFSINCESLYAQALEYRFHNNFNETNAIGMPVSPISNGSFQNDFLSEITCIPQIVYHFDFDNGVLFNNNSGHPYLSGNYSVELYFKLDSTNGYCKILDFKYPYSDYGLYCTGSLMEFYPVMQTATTAFSSGQYVHLVITRDSLSEIVNIYIDGILGLSFNDNTQLAVPDNSNQLSFFMDNTVEESSGNISLLRIYDHVINASEVIDNFNNLHDEISPIDLIVNNSIQCQAGNSFEFISEVSDSSNNYNYTWAFGDGNYAFTANANNNYLATGTYTAMITLVSGTCADSNSFVVTVNANPALYLGVDTNFCSGNTLNLDAGPGFNNYLWSDGSTGQNYLVQNTGMYWAKITDSNGCETTDSLVVTVTDLSGFSIGNDTVICMGASLNLDAGAGFISYMWNNSSNGQTLYVNIPGTYSVLVTDINGCAGNDSIMVSFAQPPAVSLGNFIWLCPGSSITLDAGNGFSTYLWNNSTQNQTLVVSTPGIYVVTVTDNNGCENSDDIIVAGTTLPYVNLGNDTTFCMGNTLNLDAGANQVSYSWQDNSMSQFFTVTSSGTYAVQVTNSNGCVNTDTIQITVNNLPADAIISLQNDTLFSDFSYGNQWYNSNGIISGATKRYFVPAVNDNYYVIRKNNFECLSDASNVIFYGSAGIFLSSNQKCIVFPNPASDVLRIDFCGSEIQEIKISIRNILGEVIINKQFTQSGKQLTIAIDELEAGIYSFAMESKNGVWVQKIMVVK